MEVKLGWAVDYGKTRFDVTVTETDLLRLLAERGADDPVKVAARMTAAHVYLVMYFEAQMFVYQSLARQEPQQKDVHDKARKQYRDYRDEVLAVYVPPPEPAPEATPF